MNSDKTALLKKQLQMQKEAEEKGETLVSLFILDKCRILKFTVDQWDTINISKKQKHN